MRISSTLALRTCYDSEDIIEYGTRLGVWNIDYWRTDRRRVLLPPCRLLYRFKSTTIDYYLLNIDSDWSGPVGQFPTMVYRDQEFPLDARTCRLVLPDVGRYTNLPSRTNIKMMKDLGELYCTLCRFVLVFYREGNMCLAWLFCGCLNYDIGSQNPLLLLSYFALLCVFCKFFVEAKHGAGVDLLVIKCRHYSLFIRSSVV